MKSGSPDLLDPSRPCRPVTGIKKKFIIFLKAGYFNYSCYLLYKFSMKLWIPKYDMNNDDIDNMITLKVIVVPVGKVPVVVCCLFRS